MLENQNFKRQVKTTLLSVFFIFIITFAIFRSSNLIFGVKIRNVNIADNARYTESTLDITGDAKNAKNLTLNGREISIDKDGNFFETIALLPGYNIITLTAKDKFGHVDEKNYKLMYQNL